MFFGALWVNIVLISKVVCDFAQDEINREVKPELSPQSIKSTNMLHLDVKPSNIMLEANGNIVLFDIGTSNVFDSSILNKTINTTRPPYTPGYAPYEQENGDVKYIGPHRDIYSLSVLFYRLHSDKKANANRNIDEWVELAVEYEIGNVASNYLSGGTIFLPITFVG